MKKWITGSGGGGGKGGGGGSGRVASESPDSLRSTAFARVLDLISEGEIDGLVDGLKSVYLDGTPIQNPDGSFNFTGVTVATVPGTQSQSPIPGFPDVEAEIGVGVEVTASVSVTRTITNADRDAARVRLSIPGLSSQDPSNGDISGTSVQIAIDLQSNGGGFVAQALGKSWSPSGPTATVASTGISPTVTWTPSGATDPESGDLIYATITFQVQYRVVGAGSWITFVTDSFTPPPGRFQTDQAPPTDARTYVIDGLASALYQVQVVKTSGDGTVAITQTSIYTPIFFDTITGKTTSTYQRSYRIALAGSPPWDIRVRRLTPDSTTVALRNKTVWDSYTEITEEQLIYPMSALAGIIIDASQFSAIPVRGYQIKGIKVRIPSNYNPVTRVYTGTWDGTFTTAWTNNPAWCFYEVLTNTRFGLGKYLDASQVDKAALYTTGKYCDGLIPDGFGGQEPRFQCSLYLQTQEEAFQTVIALASIFRGMAYWAAGAVTPVQDAPADAVFLFNESNVEGGLFTYSGSARAARHTVALVSWNDPADGFKRKPEYVEDKAGILRYGVNQVDVTAVGCTSRGQAHRLGSWLLYSEQSETELVVFRAGLDGIYLRPGAIFQVQDQHRAGIRFGGRITAAAAGSVTVDKAITIEAGKTYTIQVVLPDGTLISKTLTNAPGTTAVLTVSVNFATVPVKPAVWIVTASDLAPRTYRALQIVEAATNKFEVTGVAHNPGKFALIEQGLKLTTPRTSTITGVPSTPQNVVMSEYLYISEGSVKTMLSISWEPVLGASRYQVQYRRDLGNYVSLPVVSTTLAEAIDVLPGSYDVLVVAVNVLGNKSLAATASKVLFGKIARPADVTGFVVARNGDLLTFSWQHIADLDRDHYELRQGEAWASAVPLGQTISNTFSVTTHTGGTYLLKAVDTSGNESLNAVTCVVANNADINVVVTSDDAPTWAGVKTQTAVMSDGVVLAGQTVWDDLDQPWDAYTQSWDAIGNSYPSGTYETLPIDLGVKLTSRVEIAPVIEQDPVGGTWDDLDQPWDFYIDPWDGPPGVISATFEIATSDDGAAWSAYLTFVPGFYTARYFKFRITLRTNDPKYQPRMTDFLVTIDVPDRALHFEDQAADAVTGLVLTFSPAFVDVLTVNPTIQGGAVGDTYQVTAKSNTGTTIKVYNAAGSQKAGLLDVDVFGYGALA